MKVDLTIIDHMLDNIIKLNFKNNFYLYKIFNINIIIIFYKTYIYKVENTKEHKLNRLI
jgi:hypothetical protein